MAGAPVHALGLPILRKRGGRALQLPLGRETPHGNLHFHAAHYGQRVLRVIYYRSSLLYLRDRENPSHLRSCLPPSPWRTCSRPECAQAQSARGGAAGGAGDAAARRCHFKLFVLVSLPQTRLSPGPGRFPRQPPPPPLLQPLRCWGGQRGCRWPRGRSPSSTPALFFFFLETPSLGALWDSFPA